MNYWMTTQWPPAGGDDGQFGVFVPEGRHEKALRDFRTGDKVLIYESATDRKRKDETDQNRPRGARGIIGLATATSDLQKMNWEPIAFADGSEIWWRYYADTETVSLSGFVPHSQVLKVLGYKPLYNFRGFGDENSGLKKLTPEQYEQLAAPFLDKGMRLPPQARIPDKTEQKIKRFRNRFGKGGESDEHLQLKNYVAYAPSLALGEKGLRLIQREYSFASGDRADVVLCDKKENIIGVEIEVVVGEKDWAGVLQAIKYRFMLALVKGKTNPETRSFLVAYKIHPRIKTICKDYEVECFEISRQSVDSWTEGA